MTHLDTQATATAEHVDVLIVGAGLSGIGAACRLRTELPDRSFVILEARDAIGGTWDLFRYPGIRSDSDMFTLGYGFRPWQGAKSIADGHTIREYIVDTARAYGVDEHIRYHRRVVALSWDSSEARWTAEVRRTDTGATETVTADFVYGCTGYYRYDEGYLPELDGLDDFDGPVIHPQHWPEELDVDGKRIVVIGSGATAMTLVPALARSGAQVTMLQRSPTYVIALPDRDHLANLLNRFLPARVAHTVVKWKNVLLSSLLVLLSRRRPDLVRRLLLGQVARQLPDHLDVEEHFTPSYDPWDQRLCLVPNGDLFDALRDGSAHVVTDTTERIVPEGVVTGSGTLLECDVLVTATGLNLLMMGGIDFTVDGRRVEVPQSFTYKGMMLSGVPNFAYATGYTTASWTLKVDLVTDYVCRLLAHMDHHGYRQVTPLAPPPGHAGGSILDLDAGYILRSQHLLPKQGDGYPWQLHQNYARDSLLFKRGRLDDEGVRFTRVHEAGRATAARAIDAALRAAATSPLQEAEAPATAA